MLEIRDASSSREIQETASGGQRRVGEKKEGTVGILRVTRNQVNGVEAENTPTRCTLLECEERFTVHKRCDRCIRLTNQ